MRSPSHAPKPGLRPDTRGGAPPATIPATITAGVSLLDRDTSNSLYPEDDSKLLVKNGDFRYPRIKAGKTWDLYKEGEAVWTAIKGTYVELQKTDHKQYCELDSHWHDKTHTDPSDHGIKQRVFLTRGDYVLLFDYHSRHLNAKINRGKFTASVKVDGGAAVPLVTNDKDTVNTWRHGYANFKVAGGNAPTNAPIPVTLMFDITDSADSYGAFVTNVMILSLDLALRVDRDYNHVFNQEDYVYSRYPKGLIVDVNNIPIPGDHPVFNNSDKILPFNDKNGGNTFDPAQRVERLKVNVPANGAGADVKLRIRNPDMPLPGGKYPDDFAEGNGTQGRGQIRLFTDSPTAAEAIAPGATLYPLTPEERALAARPLLGRDFWIEGTEPGEVMIDVEYTPTGAAKALVERVRIELNVARPPANPYKASNTVEARNRVRAIKNYPRVTGIYAKIESSMEPLLTWHPVPRSASTASLWVGINTADANTWAQTGLFARSVGGQQQQGAKPYAEVAVDYAAFKRTRSSVYYHVRGGLNTLPAAGDRKWLNQDFRMMYRKVDGAWKDEIRVRTANIGLTVGEDLVVKGVQNGNASLHDKTFRTAQAGFEASQSVTRVPGIPNQPAKFSAIEVCEADTAADVERINGNATGKFVPSPSFKLIDLAEKNLQIMAVANNGKEVPRARNFSHYRIQRQSPHDVLLWDKYNWMPILNLPPGAVIETPGMTANPGTNW